MMNGGMDGLHNKVMHNNGSKRSINKKVRDEGSTDGAGLSPNNAN
jgi:hypothetical protein